MGARDTSQKGRYTDGGGEVNMQSESEPQKNPPAHWLLALLLCAAGSLVVLWEPLIGDRSALSFDVGHPRYPAPWQTPSDAEWPLINPITSDGDFMVLPGLMRLAQFDALDQSMLWDSGQLLGHVLAANQVHPIWLPWARAMLHWPAVDAMDWLIWIHMVFASFLAWRAVRLMGGSGLAAAFGAVAFTFSTWMVTRWHLPVIYYTSAFFPGILVAVEWLRRGRYGWAVAEGGLWMGVALSAGFPQVGLLFVLGFLALVVLERRLWTLRVGVSCLLALVFAFGLAAPLLTALGQSFPHAARASEQARLEMGQHGLRPQALLGALVPELYGRPSDFSTEQPPAPSMEEYLPRRLLMTDDVQDNPVEDALYPGVLVLLLLPLLLRRSAGRRARQLGMLSALAILSALLANWLFEHFPALASLSGGSSKRVLVLMAAPLPLAAALALDSLRRNEQRPPLFWGGVLLGLLGAVWMLFAGLDEPDLSEFLQALRPQLLRQAAFVLVGLALLAAYARRKSWAGPLLVAVLAVDLVSLGWAFNPFPSQVEPFGTRPTLEWLAQQPGRVAVLGSRRSLPPSGAALHGIRTLHGNIPMLDRRVAELIGVLEPDLVDWRDPRSVEPLQNLETLDHNLLDLLEVSTVVHADPGLAVRRGVPNDWENMDDVLAAFSRAGAGPRAFVCRGSEVHPEAASRLKWLGNPDAPVHESVLLEEPSPFALPARGGMVAVDVVEQEPGRFTLNWDASFDGVLVLTEAWHSDWQAWLDGEPVDLQPVDHALIGLPVRAGAHRLELAFHLPREVLSWWLRYASAAGLLLCAVLGSKRSGGDPALG